MIRKRFVNRESEMKFLNEAYKRKGFEFVVLTGRRRIGKSRLLEEFLKDKYCIYFLAENRVYEYNLDKFSAAISEFFDIPKVNVNSLRQAFELIVKLKRKRIVIAIDEFSYLVKHNPYVVGEMQGIIDEVLKDENVFLILSGSAVSLIQKELLSYSSPLYGRTTGTVFLKPLSFSNFFEWYGNRSIEEIIKIFSVTDGIPKYMEFFECKDAEKEIIRTFFNPHSFLFREMVEILSEELRNVGLYFSVLEAVSLGKNRATEIANYSYLKPSEVSAYLRILENLGFVKKIVPLFGKKGIYDISDNYTKFWFRFVSKHFSEIEEGFSDSALHDFRKNFNTYLGFVFEDLILRLFKEGRFRIFPFTKIGKWWHKDREIDIIALNEKTREILFGECKWKSRINAEKICKELVEKAEHVEWHRGRRKEILAVFAKSFSKRIDEFEDRKVLCFDLRDLGKIYKL